MWKFLTGINQLLSLTVLSYNQIEEISQRTSDQDMGHLGMAQGCQRTSSGEDTCNGMI